MLESAISRLSNLGRPKSVLTHRCTNVWSILRLDRSADEIKLVGAGLCIYTTVYVMRTPSPYFRLLVICLDAAHGEVEVLDRRSVKASGGCLSVGTASQPLPRWMS